MTKWNSFLIAAAFLALPALVFAAGGHDGLSCTGCHSLHQAKTEDFILAVQPNTKDVNPKTKQPYQGTTAICLGCHQTSEKGGHGMTPIDSHMSHPYGLSSINPKERAAGSLRRLPRNPKRNGNDGNVQGVLKR